MHLTKKGVNLKFSQNIWFDIFCFKKLPFFQKLSSYRPTNFVVCYDCLAFCGLLLHHWKKRSREKSKKSQRNHTLESILSLGGLLLKRVLGGGA
jgi:hypothetical protein